MQIVIDIPKKTYNEIKERTIVTCGETFAKKLVGYIRKGIPLPEHHGDLIDKDRLLDELEKTVKSVDDTNKHLLFWDRAVAHVHLSKPIIEADMCTYKETGCGSCKRQLDCPIEAEGE